MSLGTTMISVISFFWGVGGVRVMVLIQQVPYSGTLLLSLKTTFIMFMTSVNDLTGWSFIKMHSIKALVGEKTHTWSVFMHTREHFT